MVRHVNINSYLLSVFLLDGYHSSVQKNLYLWMKIEIHTISSVLGVLSDTTKFLLVGSFCLPFWHVKWIWNRQCIGRNRSKNLAIASGSDVWCFWWHQMFWSRNDKFFGIIYFFRNYLLYAHVSTWITWASVSQEPTKLTQYYFVIDLITSGN